MFQTINHFKLKHKKKSQYNRQNVIRKKEKLQEETGLLIWKLSDIIK